MKSSSHITRTPVPQPQPRRDMGVTFTLTEREGKMLRLLMGQIGGYNTIRTELVTPLFKRLNMHYPLADTDTMPPRPFSGSGNLDNDMDVDAALALFDTKEV